MIDTSTSSSSTIGDRWIEFGMDKYKEDSKGSVAKISSLRVSSRGSTISGSAAWSTYAYRSIHFSAYPTHTDV